MTLPSKLTTESEAPMTTDELQGWKQTVADYRAARDAMSTALGQAQAELERTLQIADEAYRSLRAGRHAETEEYLRGLSTEAARARVRQATRQSVPGPVM